MQILAAKLIRSIVNGQLSIAAILFSLFLFPFSFFPSAAHAAEPTPLPCQYPIIDEGILTDNWLVDENKKPPPGLHRIKITVIRPAGLHHISEPVNFTVDFSQLGALFGPTNSNYLEGKFQDEGHRSTNVAGLSPADISKYHGAGQKAAPRAMLDALRVKYVDYVNNNPTLAESGNLFTDFNGQNPKTINDMVVAFGDNPVPPSAGGNKEAWQNGWGKYWDKIPTAYSEFYEAKIVFREESHILDRDFIQKVLDKEYCPDRLPREIKFVMPEFFRTTATSGQLNQVIVPKAAQSTHTNNLILEGYQGQSAQSQSVLGKIIDTCLKVFKNNPISESLRKVISFLIDEAWLFPPVLAQSNQSEPPDPNDCIRILKDGKEGQDPYCALPRDQLEAGESCTNQEDPYKVDKDNPRVICHFKINWEPHHNPMRIPDVGPNHNQWDECHPVGRGLWSCTVEVSIWPIFRIPWQTELWNNTLYSDIKDREPFIGSPLDQVTGRPGVYSFFTPVSIFETEIEALVRKCRPETDPQSQACSDLVNLASTSIEEWNRLYNSNLEDCFERFLPGPGAPPDSLEQLEKCIKNEFASLEKKKPGETDRSTDDDLGRRFIGGTDCSKEYVWHNALYPKAAQQQFGITNDCPELAAAQIPDQGSQPPIDTPGNFPPTDDNCDGTYALDNPLGNFGDPNCDFGIDPFFDEVDRLDPANAETWTCLALYESGFNPNAYNPNASAGQAFGLFQMGHAAYPQYGLDYQIADPGTEFDRGDVEWKVQIANAINYNNQLLGGDFFNDQGVSYWEPINSGLC